MSTPSGETTMRDEALGELRREMHEGFKNVHSRLDAMVTEMGGCRLQCQKEVVTLQGDVKNLTTAVGEGDNGGSGLRGAVKRHEADIQQTRGSMKMLGWVWLVVTGALASLVAFKDILFPGGAK